MGIDTEIPVLGFAAFSGTGKTTLLRQVIARLNHRGVRVGVIKHAHHDFDIDYPGKDSYELRKAGASKTLVVSDVRWALVTELARQGEVPLQTVLTCLDPADLDLVLVEGYKHERIPKIELHRSALDKPFLYPEDDTIFAIATDAPDRVAGEIEVLDMNDIEQIVRFICSYAGVSYDKGISNASSVR